MFSTSALFLFSIPPPLHFTFPVQVGGEAAARSQRAKSHFVLARNFLSHLIWDSLSPALSRWWRDVISDTWEEAASFSLQEDDAAVYGLHVPKSSGSLYWPPFGLLGWDQSTVAWHRGLGWWSRIAWKAVSSACFGCSSEQRLWCRKANTQSSLQHNSSISVYWGTQEDLRLWENITELSWWGTLKDQYRIMAVFYRDTCHLWVEPLPPHTRTKASHSAWNWKKNVVKKCQIGCCTLWKDEFCLLFH